jgi:hypothetical protein
LGKDELLRPLVLLWIFQCVLSNIVKGRLWDKKINIILGGRIWEILDRVAR